MTRTRGLHSPASVLALACVSGLFIACASAKHGPEKSETPADAAPPAQPVAAAKPQLPAKPVQLARVDMQVENLEDMFVAADKVAQIWAETPPNATSKATVSNLLLAGGFKESFATSLDWTGRWDIYAEVPTEDGDNAFAKYAILRGALPAVQSAALIASLPANLGVKAIGENLFRATPEGEPNMSLTLQAAAKHMLFGRTNADLAPALALTSRGSQSNGKRVSISAANLPESALQDLAEGGPFAAQLKDLLKASTARVSLDFGTDRDASYTMEATGNFAQFTYDLVGAPLTQPSALAARLPGHAIAAIVVPWGNPKFAFDQVKKQLAGVPAPFDKLAAESVTPVEPLCGQIPAEVVLAFYLDKKGKLALVVAANVKDEAAAVSTIDAVWSDATRAKDLFFAATGDEKAAAASKYTANVKFGKATGRTLSIALSSEQATQLAADSDTKLLATMALDKQGKGSSFSMHSVVHQGAAFFALGAGAKTKLAEVTAGKALKDNLETDGGLADARALSGGCQVCMKVDTVAATDFALRVASANAANPKLAKSLAAKLAKLKFDYDLAGGIRMDKTAFVGAAAVPKELLFLDRKEAQILVEIFDGIDNLDEAPETAATPAASGKKGS